MTREDELEHRKSLWQRLQQEDIGGLNPALLRELGVYGGAQGIWVDKRRTGALTADGNGVTVGVLHTGQHYPDDLSDEGLIYHYPQTGRPVRRDLAEISATKAANELKLPIFIILKSANKRRVLLGWVEDWDDSSSQYLILFGETEPPYTPASNDDSPFVLTEHAERRVGRVKLRAGQQQFRFSVIKKYGCKCAVCSITHPQLIVAAHVRSKASFGSDDWRNGLPLCHTHHAAFDAGLFDIEPETLRIVAATRITPSSIGLTADKLDTVRQAPHIDALQWRWNSSDREPMSVDTVPVTTS